MKNIYSILMFACSLLFVNTNVSAQNKGIEQGIQWISIEEAEAKQKVAPRKIFMDVYTDWCGWCKVMDKKTFSNPKAIQFMNDNYYCVKLNAETLKTINYKGKKYETEPGVSVNPLVLEWMNNKLSYPTSLFFDENFKLIQPLPGYLELKTFEEIVRFLAKDAYTQMPFDDYKKQLNDRW